MYRKGGGQKGRGGGRSGGRGNGWNQGRGGNQGRSGICFDWRDTGRCRRGNNCKFSHVGSGGSQTVQQSSSQKISKSSDDTRQYIRHLSFLPPNKIHSDLARSSSLWRRCWTEQQHLDQRTRCMLIEILTKIPGSSSVEPPPVRQLKDTLCLYVNDQVPNDSISNDKVLTTTKTVLNAVTRLLQFEWEVSIEEVKDTLSSVILKADGKLRKAQKEHRDFSSRLMETLDDIMDKPWRIRLRESTVVSESVVEALPEPVYGDWQSATIKWLSNPKFFSPACCPVMKVGSAGVYDSADDYMERVHRLWIAMTFSDGFASIAPKCCSRGQSGSCNNALWPIADERQNIQNLNCRRCGKSNPATFACRISSHDALCNGCVSRSINHHLGPKGQRAATHIYDATVKNVSADGILYVSNFESRNPPPNIIHWRTTQRLSPPNLVGVVKLRAEGVALVDMDRIKWGEVVYHGHNRDEERKRQSGQVAINLSSITEFEPDYFDEGACVAIIDCMTFVPEWIPVLHALESQMKTRLPFDNGKYLNLWKDKPVESKSALDDLSADAIFAADRHRLIENMVNESLLEPIREVRRDETLRAQLVAQLEKLVVQTTLDKMQLISFIDALHNPVHLTQGPPGTGKSYLGVVLVRALIVIRKFWIKKSPTVGTPPILVLSYKNHAIDEFLVDLVTAERLGNKLIRIGGKCNDARLAQYSESSIYQSDADVKMKRNDVEKLDRLRESILVTLDGVVASFQSNRHKIFVMGETDDDPRNRRKAAVSATVILMETFIRLNLLKSTLQEESDEDQPNPRDISNNFTFLELGKNREASNVLRNHMNKAHGAQFISELVKGVSHYGRSVNHWGDVLCMWISGKHPLPICEFIHMSTGKKCGQLASSPDLPLCGQHRCQYLAANENICRAACKSDQYSFCVEHCCAVDECPFHIFRTQQMLCKTHACRRCISLGLVAALATDDPPWNVCDEHPLCMVPSCLEFCVGDGMYCDNHNEVKCSALTKRKRPCKGTPLSRSIPFCGDHMHLHKKHTDEEDIVEEENSTVNKNKVDLCSAKTNEGLPCQRTALTGSLYCYDHSPPEVIGDMDAAFSSNLVQNKDIVDVDPEGKILSSSNTLTDQDISSEMTKKEEPQCEIDDVSFTTANSSTSVRESPQNVTTDADELDIEDEGENLQHLRDVFEVEDRDVASESGDNTEEDSLLDFDEESFSSDHIAHMTDPNTWSWEMSVEDRWSACQMLMEQLQALMKKADIRVKSAVIIARKDLQRAKVLAKARLYENRSVIGGTMVGCITRLESIRATRPFAIVVEEASEVLEPLLFSCLSESTVKLEMIGDHRQLQPSVMSRFDFEQRNKINISMFQRLIESPSGHEIPSTVLSVQRRMRKNICDLTRNLYADVTQIEDHDVCNSQVIGQREASVHSNVLQSSATGGREVPGVGPHIFLWTHDGKQERAKVGVSRINSEEATKACALAAYLVDCGVPRSSIAILTPYKGQLMLMRNLLLKTPAFASKRLLSKDPSESNVCRLSTVDRFQGDEEDIIICSLVVDEKSKTGFIKLQNRMVVLLSRARLGLYILGNVGYFESQTGAMPRHWANIFHIVQSVSVDDSASNLVKSSEAFGGVRTGRNIPLCCPVHRHVVTDVASASGLKRGFCSVVCHHTLPCEHSCALQCHWPSNAHSKRCTVQLDSPCQRHLEKIECHQLFENARGARNLEFALSGYLCPIKMDSTLSCGHIVSLSCWNEAKMMTGELSWPDCNKRSPSPYFHKCGHEQRSVTCSKLVQFTENPSLVKCEQEIDYHPACGHSARMKCWQQEAILSGSRTYVCSKSQTVILPRCGHTHTVPCRDSQQIANWIGTSCVERGRVIEGVSYGPHDYACKERVTFVRICKHEIHLPCSQAFAQSNSLGACHELVATRSPRCGHTCHMRCVDMHDLEGLDFPIVTTEYHEEHIPSPKPLPIGIVVPRCTEIVRLIRKCGHIEKVECSEIRNPRVGCTIPVRVQSPLCGHQVTLPCRLKGDIDTDIWSKDTFDIISKTGTIPKDALSMVNMVPLSKDLQAELGGCPLSLLATLDCGHKQLIKCSHLFQFLSNPNKSCDTLVHTKLRCDHLAQTECFRSTLYKDGKADIPCNGLTSQACWNCNTMLQVRCGFEGAVGCERSSLWTCPVNKTHAYTINQCSEGPPINCPGCSLDSIYAAIETCCPVPGREQLSLKLNCVESKGIEWLASPDIDKFIQQEKEIIERQKGHTESLPLWDRSVFQNQRVPCFRVLKGDHVSTNSFDPKIFAKPNTLSGIVTKQLTPNNLMTLARDGDKNITLLLGYASVCRTFAFDKETLPKKLKPKQHLLRNIQNGMYDSMVHVSASGYHHLIIWEPFPLIAICRVTLSNEDLQRMSHNLQGDSTYNLKPIRIARKSLPDKLILSEPHSIECDEDSASKEFIMDIVGGLDGTLLAGLAVDTSWSQSACIMSKGRLNECVEADLEIKMQFINQDARPFAAIKLLQTLIRSKIADTPLLYLLLAAELSFHSKPDALEAFNRYLEEIRGDKSQCLHPWALIVGSRLEDDVEHSKRLLRNFMELFSFCDVFLTKEELELVGDSDEEDEGSEFSDVPDPIQRHWIKLQHDYPVEAKSDAMESLLKLTGLGKVKKEALSIWQSALQLHRMDPETRKQNLPMANYCFLGNPGTGKTTVARLFAGILCDSGLRERNTFIETTAQQLKDGGTDEFQKLAKSAMDGALFIDEAYDLDPVGDFKGKPIVSDMLTLSENKRDRVSIILAGYEDEFQEKFFKYNPGLKSRFIEVQFEDFDEHELAKIWTEMRNLKKWQELPGVCSVIVKRMVKLSGRKGFGNAREVRKRLESATKAAMGRLGTKLNNSTMCLEIEDVIGEDPRLTNAKLLRVREAFEKKIGWKRVKEAIKSLIDLCGTNYRRELLSKPPLDLVFNRMFLGSPGTGKTTCATLYGQLLKELGFLSIGDVVSKTASDFVGSHVGESQNKTQQILESARGKVLIIDEAYALDDSLYGKQVLDTLVEKIQGGPSDDIAVLLLGYEEPMLRMINEQNPGLFRRFPPEHAFYFDDYSEHELLEILDLNLKMYDLKATLEFKEKASEIFRVQKTQSNFGNAGAVELLVKGASLMMAKRDNDESNDTSVLKDSDIMDPGTNQAEKYEDHLSRLENLFKMDAVKQKMEKMKKNLTVAKRDGDNAPEIGHFVFTGSPGTGKTTVARVMSSILYDLGLKPSSKIVETSGLKLTGEFVGHTKKEVEKCLKEAKGGVLFIDEAYTLGEGTFGKEACDSLVEAMTSKEFIDVTIVIAGYSSEINEMLDRNAGLKSRFTEFFEFPDWEAKDCVAFFQKLALDANFELGEGVLDKISYGCSDLLKLDGWANGRDVNALWKSTKEERAGRVYEDTDEITKDIVLKDVKSAVIAMIKSRIPGGQLPEEGSDPLALLDKLYRMDNIKTKLEKMQKALVVAKRDGDDMPKLGHFVFTGSPGTGKTTVARVLAEILCGLGLKPSSKIVETSGLKLTGEFVGHTKKEVEKCLKEAKGGVLFIDEAYTLGEGTFGKEACDSLVEAMTSKEFIDVTIVIAGYSSETNEMLDRNAGLKSRFTEFFEFPDWEAKDCVAFFQKLALDANFELGEGVLDKISYGCSVLLKLDGWANGRDISSLWSRVKEQRAQRVFGDSDVTLSKKIVAMDVTSAVIEMTNSRAVVTPLRKRGGGPSEDGACEVALGPESLSYRDTRTESQIEVYDDITLVVDDREDLIALEFDPSGFVENALFEAEKNHLANVGDTSKELFIDLKAPQMSEDNNIEHLDDLDQKWDSMNEAASSCVDRVGVDHGTDTKVEIVKSDVASENSYSDFDDNDNGASEKHDIIDFEEDKDERDDGVTDEVWESLKLEKEAERKKMKEVEMKRLAYKRFIEEQRIKEEQARIQLEEELERIRKDLEQKEQERAIRIAIQAEERRKRRAALEQKHREEAEQKLQEEVRHKEEIQCRLQKLNPCPMGFSWFKQGCGWRCGGGSHYVSDEQLRKQFMSNI